MITETQATDNELIFGSESDDDDPPMTGYDSRPKTITNPNPNPKPKFMDEDEESEDDEEVPEPTLNLATDPSQFQICQEKTIGIEEYQNYIFPHVNNYIFKTWNEYFPNQKVNLESLIFNSEWFEFIEQVANKKYYNNIEKILSKCLEKKQFIVPYPQLIFNAMNTMYLRNIRVVIIGQDPYFGVLQINGKRIPQGMGNCFSVCVGFPKPPSLTNIYGNLHKFGHVKQKPSSGNLSMWALQGCLMINSALTTVQGMPGAHQALWKDFTTDLIRYINTKCDGVVFLAWGAHAHKLCLNIDPTKHKIITSSHPSPMSFMNTLDGLTYGMDPTKRKQITYPPFKDVDHFGEVNRYLQQKEKQPILWDLFIS